jgi:ribosome biogenesis GTPase / thiamine phosphate phosphatase
VNLAALGWRAEHEIEFAALRRAQPTLRAARVVAQLRGVLVLADGESDYEGRPAGRLRHEASNALDLPAVGDWVAFEPAVGGSIVLVRAILERRSAFVRKAAGEGTEPQVVAANVDRILLVTPLGQPLNLRRLERFLAFARETRAEAWILLSKADLVTPEEAELALRQCAELGVPARLVSVRRGEGLPDLVETLEPGRTYALVGASGAGKSTLANALAGQEKMRTGQVLDDGRGQHTTSHRELLRLPQGALLLDTPGLRELQVWDLDETLTATFEDIEALAANCRFGDCRHRAEPGCAVLAAVESGALEASRLESLRKLEGENAAAARKRDERVRLESKRQAKSLTRALRDRVKDKYR